MIRQTSHVVSAVGWLVVHSSFATTATAQPNNTYHYVANTQPSDASPSLRNEPTTRGAQRLMMPNGTFLQIVRRQDDGWWLVRIAESGQKGWALNTQDDRRWIECCKAAPLSNRGGRVAEQRDRLALEQTRNVQIAPPIVLAEASASVSYEGTLKTLGAKLVGQLETAGQKSGTVLDFTDLQGHGTELGRFLAQELSDQLVAAARTLALVDRANLQHLLRENRMSLDGLINTETSRKLGNMIGIDTVIFGTVTLIGNNIRLSVRAVAVETGKIVASQSATLPPNKELSELYTRGVASSPSGPTEVRAATPERSKLRDRLRADSLKLRASEVAIAQSGLLVGAPATVSISLQNASGIGLGVGVAHFAYSAGPCTPHDGYQAGVAGLPSVNRDQYSQLSKEAQPSRRLQWVPSGASVSATLSISYFDCSENRVAGLKSVPVSLTLVLASENEIMTMPLSVDNVPLRIVRPRPQ